MAKTDTTDLQDTMDENRKDSLERLAERKGKDVDDLTEVEKGDVWTAQWGTTQPLANDPNSGQPQQYFTADQMPDPRLAAAASLDPVAFPEHLMADGLEGTGIVDWHDAPLEIGDRAQPNFQPGEFGPGNYRGGSTDHFDLDVGWTAQVATQARPDPLNDPQTAGKYGKRVFSQAEMPDPANLPPGWRSVPGYSATNERSPKLLDVRPAADFESAGDAFGHPRGPEPRLPADRAVTRAAVEARLQSDGVWGDVPMQTIKQSSDLDSDEMDEMREAQAEIEAERVEDAESQSAEEAVTEQEESVQENREPQAEDLGPVEDEDEDDTENSEPDQFEPEDSDVEAEPDQFEDEEEEDEPGLSNHSLADLRDLAAEKGIEGRSYMNKSELVAALESCGTD